MRLPGDGGAAALGQALLLGLGLALLYDLLRPLRHRAGGAAPLLDLSFSVLAGAPTDASACGSWRLH